MHEIIHIIPNRLNKNTNIFLLFIPILIFVLALALIIAKVQKPSVATTNQTPAVLGTDNPQ